MSLDSTTNAEVAAEADAPPAQSDLDRKINQLFPGVVVRRTS